MLTPMSQLYGNLIEDRMEYLTVLLQCFITGQTGIIIIKDLINIKVLQLLLVKLVRIKEKHIL